MLSGIKRGKRKRPTTAASAAASAADAVSVDPSTISTGHGCRGDVDQDSGGDNHDDAKQQPGVARRTDHVQHPRAPANNQTAAEALRRSLLSGVVKPSFSSSSSPSSPSRRPNNHDNNDNNSQNHNIHHPEEDFSLKRLERRGRILGPRDDLHAEAETTIVLPSLPSSASHDASKSAHGRRIHRETVDRDLSVSEMRRHEGRSHHHNGDDDENDMDEVYARNILRLGKSYKSHHDALSTLHNGSGADEDDATGEMAHLVHRLYRSHDDRLTRQQRMQKETSRQLARQRGMERFTRRSSWWVESPSFQKRYLIALGEKVSLVMIPSHETLTWKEGDGQGKGDDYHPSHANSNAHHSKEGSTRTKIPPTCPYPCRIVPLSHAASISSLDEDAWDEVRRFRQSLRRMYRKYNMGVLFLETVHGNVNHGLQAKMEMVPVPREVERDAPLYFKHALAEAAQEWGVHGRSPIGVRDHDETGGNTISATSNTHININTSKTLRNAVPKGFPYFYVGWEGGGYVQLIETDDHGGGDDDDDGGGIGGSAGLGGMGLSGGGGGRGNSNAFWRDFGMDTIAGMMGLDPVRFRRRPPARDGDKARILEFCDKWKEFDWTLELD